MGIKSKQMPITLLYAEELVSGGILKSSPITTQSDPADYAPFLQLAEERYLVPLICRAMYDDMIAQMNTVPSNYNPDLGPIVLKFPNDPNYETLWTQYLLQLTSWATILQALPFLALKIGANGIFLNSIEWGENAGIKGVQFLEDRVKQNLQTSQGLMQDFLCQNYTDYPEFDSKRLCTSCTCVGSCGCPEIGKRSNRKQVFDGGLLDSPSQAQPYRKNTNFFL